MRTGTGMGTAQLFSSRVGLGQARRPPGRRTAEPICDPRGLRAAVVAEQVEEEVEGVARRREMSASEAAGTHSGNISLLVSCSAVIIVGHPSRFLG